MKPGGWLRFCAAAVVAWSISGCITGSTLRSSPSPMVSATAPMDAALRRLALLGLAWRGPPCAGVERGFAGRVIVRQAKDK